MGDVRRSCSGYHPADRRRHSDAIPRDDFASACGEIVQTLESDAENRRLYLIQATITPVRPNDLVFVGPAVLPQ